MGEAIRISTIPDVLSDICGMLEPREDEESDPGDHEEHVHDRSRRSDDDGIRFHAVHFFPENSLPTDPKEEEFDSIQKAIANGTVVQINA